MKKCTMCMTTKPLSDFYRSSHTKDGLTCHCKACQAAEKAARKERKLLGLPPPPRRTVNVYRAKPRDSRRASTEELRELLDYDPETGVLRWKVRPPEHFHVPGWAAFWNRRHAGKVAGKSYAGRPGYLVVTIRSFPHLAHRVAWAILYGEVPEQIDHINGDGEDNRLCNLRACTQADNQHNQAVRKTNKSGYKGVCWSDRLGRWRATIFINGKQKHLGLFDCPEEAHKAYCAAADELHGDFANHGRFKQPPSVPRLPASVARSDGPKAPSRQPGHRTT